MNVAQTVAYTYVKGWRTQTMWILRALPVIFGLAIAVYGIFGRKLFYNAVDMPLTEKEKADTRPPTRNERIAYVSFGAVLVLFGLSKLL